MNKLIVFAAHACAAITPAFAILGLFAMPGPAAAQTAQYPQDFDTLVAAGNNRPKGIWSDGTIMWVADWDDDKIYAYDLRTKSRRPGEDFDTLLAAGNNNPEGIWSDGVTMWVADNDDDKIFAYDMRTKARNPDKDFE